MSTYKYNHTLKLFSNIVGINGNDLFSEINKHPCKLYKICSNHCIVNAELEWPSAGVTYVEIDFPLR